MNEPIQKNGRARLFFVALGLSVLLMLAVTGIEALNRTEGLFLSPVPTDALASVANILFGTALGLLKAMKPEDQG